MQENKDPVQQAHHVEVNHWLRMMGRLDDPVVARLVLKFLNENPRIRLEHPGAFLLASETVKRSQIRYAKAYAVGKFSRSACSLVGRGIAAATGRVCLLVVAGCSGLQKLVRNMRRPLDADVRQRAASPVWRRCVVRQRRNESHVQRGVPRPRC